MTLLAHSVTPLLGTPLDGLRLRGGSVVGRRHLLSQRNNQDALALHHPAGGRAWVAALADGCSAGRASEVGAQLATRFALRFLEHLGPARHELAAPELAAKLEAGLLDYLGQVLEPLRAASDLAPLLQDLALFTFFVLIVDPARTVVLGLGDGLIADPERVKRIVPTRPDQPDYIAYHLLRGGLGAEHLRPLYERPTKEVRTLLVASDGLFPLADAEIEALVRDQESKESPLALERHLRVLAHRQRRLHDDATAVLLSRKETSPCVSR